MTAYYVPTQTRRYCVEIHHDPHTRDLMGMGMLSDQFNVIRWDDNGSRQRFTESEQLRSAAQSTKGEGKRFLLTYGRAGYAQGDYGVKLATSWKDPIIGVAVFDPDCLEVPDPTPTRRHIAQSYLDEWTSVYLGDVYGVVVKDERGNVVDSCWGYVGDEWAQENAQDTFAQWNPTAEVPEFPMSEMVYSG